MAAILQRHGVSVCGSEFGKQLGGGLFEFRLRDVVDAPDGGGSERVLLRVFCHAYGERVVLLLGGYDKGRSPSRSRQAREIATARTRLARWQARTRL